MMKQRTAKRAEKSEAGKQEDREKGAAVPEKDNAAATTSCFPAFPSPCEARLRIDESGKQERRKRSAVVAENTAASSSCFPAFLIHKSPAQFRARLVRWFAKNARDLPWRRTRDPYAILVSEVMLQQTQAAAVIPFFEKWMRRFPTVESLARASEADVLAMWQGLGYYSRARNLHRAANAVLERFGGIFPRGLADIRALPGAGHYTAGAVATFAFDAATPIVDANIARVLARIFLVEMPVDSGAGQKAIWRHAGELQPKKNARLFNGALMELGALVCTPRAPKCPACPVAQSCRACALGAQDRLPVKKPRRETVALSENCALILSKNRILLEQQTSARWRGLWKLPPLPAAPMDEKPLVRLDYPFTHHRVTLSVFKAPAPAKPARNQAWHALASLDALAIPSPHRRALVALLRPSRRLPRARGAL